MHIGHLLTLYCIRMAVILFFVIVRSIPHNLVLESQPGFGLIPLEFLNLYNFLINKRIFMKIVAKCLVFISIAYQVRVKRIVILFQCQ